MNVLLVISLFPFFLFCENIAYSIFVAMRIGNFGKCNLTLISKVKILHAYNYLRKRYLFSQYLPP